MNRPEHYILVGRTPVAVDLMTWAEWLKKDATKRRVGYDDITENCHVSTVFLGLDHNWYDDGDPILFETLIDGGPLDQEMQRYCTYAEAERGHAAAVAAARKACEQVQAIGNAAGAKQPT